MKKQFSFIELIDVYLDYRASGGLKNKIRRRDITLFYHNCCKHFNDAEFITQEMIDWWCKQRDTETLISAHSRISPIRSFLIFVKERGYIECKIPKIITLPSSTYKPHGFTEEELANFFRACDEHVLETKSSHRKFSRLTFNIFFRLLYSSGLRITEVTRLYRSDVDLQTGVINICRTKGYGEHRIVLHDSIRKLLIKYDEIASARLPDRRPFFSTWKNGEISIKWNESRFHSMWNKYNDTSIKVCPYDLRHHYAIFNINSWIGFNIDIHDKLVILSKSMGHIDLKSTLYYYSLVPQLANTIEMIGGQFYENIIPNLPNDEEEY